MQLVGRDRCTRLLELAIERFPVDAVEAASRKGRNARGLEVATDICVASVKQEWAKEFGIGPLWLMLFSGTVRAIVEILIRYWLENNDVRMAINAEAGRKESV